MKRYFLSGLSALLILSSCKKDFEVAAPYKDITVVYGILNQLDTAHYIRIEKAFLDESKSAIDMSKVPDSSFYKDLSVKIQECDLSGKLLNETPLSLVDLNLEGYPKEQPANEQGFFTSPSYAYKFKKTLNGTDARYRLIITNNATGKIDSSQLVGVVNSDTAHAGNNNNGKNFYIADFAKANYGIDFARSGASYEFLIRGNTPRNGSLVEGKIRFHYVDSNEASAQGTRKYVDLYIPGEKESYSEGNTFQVKTLNRNIYSFLRDAMGLPASNISRYFTNCEVWVYCANADLAQYKKIALAQAGGLTGDQIKPNFTNMRGADILGLLASKTYRYYPKAVITPLTLDSLQTNSVTQPLNIKGIVQ